MYRIVTGKRLNLKKPRTFNEKLQWLKLHDRNPQYTKMVDKYEVRQYIKETIGEKYLIPLVGGPWERFDDIDFLNLPEQFVLKCTHDSGSVVICKDKNKFDIQSARKKINRALKGNFFYGGREWPYKNIKPRIIAEKYMVDEFGKNLNDYKIFNFNGIPRLIQVDFNRFENHRHNYFSPAWDFLDVYINHSNDPNTKIERPQKLDELLDLAKKLSHGIIHLRTDFYIMGNKIFFGELTFYHESGFGRFTPEEFEEQMGEWIRLPFER